MTYIGVGALLFGIGMLSGLTLIIKIAFDKFHIKKKQEKFLWWAFTIGMVGGLVSFFQGQY
ncbi:MAG: hypothetical protein HZA78_02055 [Candidatus Schekmanbacteria bacterium]|nr:hypothetical protein [Candidatus Schekmanbacteria bacterium]